MSTMVWDESGARYYETGVSKGILFPIDGSTGVPWNGLVSVNIDPLGGEPESYYFDGLKYMDRVLSEDFQATIQAISTPREFAACEGVQAEQPGMYTHFNKRDKFNLVWRTEIGSDEGTAVAYKWHIAYNCLVQPSARAYQTISDTSNMDVRSFVITTTPACGRHSYYTFDSRDADLTAIETQLYAGVLPRCFELATVLGSPTSDADCPSLVENFDSYRYGQIVSDDKTGVNTETEIDGRINNGLDVTELPAVGAFAANDSAASEVGTGDILADDDDATYITSADGDTGYTIGLPPLVGYVEDCTFELHIRMSISGGVDPDDPDNLDADAQVHISTEAGGDDTIGGFSDGTDEGMSFSLDLVDGTPVDYVVPLYMDSWVDTTIDDVVAALEAGAFLTFVGAYNNNPDTTPEVRVYEASVVMLNDTESSKSLRFTDDHTDASVVMNIYDPSTTDNVIEQLTETIDFKIIQVPYNSAADGFTQDILDWRVITGTSPGAIRLIPNGDGIPQLAWKADNGTTDLIAYVDVPKDTWFTAQADWNTGSLRVRVYDRDQTLSDSILDHTITTTMDPTALVKHWAGYVGADGDSIVNHEVMIDNATMQIHCKPVDPVSDIVHPGTVTSAMGTPTIVGALPLEDDDDGSYVTLVTSTDGSTLTHFDRVTAPVYETLNSSYAPEKLVVKLRAKIATTDSIGSARVSIGLRDRFDDSPYVLLTGTPSLGGWMLPDTGGVAQNFELVLTDSYFTAQGSSFADIVAMLQSNRGGFVLQNGITTAGTAGESTVTMYALSIEPTDWVGLDLSSMDPKMGNPSHIDMAAYTGGKIVGTPEWGDTSATFSIPGLTLDPTKTYDFEFTWNSPDTNEAYGIMQQNPAWATTFFSDNRELFYQFPGGSGVFVATIGPGIDDWNTAVTDDYQTLIRFDVSNGLVSLRYKEHV